MANFANAGRRLRVTEVSEDKVPAVNRHPKLDGTFAELANYASMPQPVAGASVGHSRGKTRLMAEIRAIAATPSNKFDCYVSEQDMRFWKIVMEGPDGSPYAGGVFLFYLDIGEDYPTFAPKA